MPDTISPRRYSSPLRERQALQTRDLILDALTDLLEAHRADEITTREIARTAGVSERTVYRHFPDREALLAGLSDRLHDLTGTDPLDDGAPAIPTWADLKAVAVRFMEASDEFHVVARAEALFNADPRRFSAATRAHSGRLHTVIAGAFTELDERDHQRLAAVVRCLLSAQAWLRMREEFGVPGEESGPMVAWVLDAMFNEIRRGNRPPSKFSGRADPPSKPLPTPDL